MNPLVTSPPVALPVSLAEVKAQLQIDSDDYDARLGAMTAVATRRIETEINRALITRSYQAFLNWWPRTERGFVKREIELQPGPMQSFTGLTTYDDQDTATVFDPSQYYVDTARDTGRIVLRWGCIWPTGVYRVANGIQLEWVAGYGDAPAAIPEEIRQAILIQVGVLNEQRGDLDASRADVLAPIVRALIGPYYSPLIV